jgi:hypothetical protein
VNEIRKIRIWRAVNGEPMAEELDVGPTPVPGLVVGYYPHGANAGWYVIHEVSGLGISDAGSPEHGLAIAVALQDVTDWTAPASALQGAPGLREAVIDAAAPLGGSFRGPTASPEVVAAAEASGAA